MKYEEILRIYGFDKIKTKSIFKESKNDNQILNPKLKSFYKSKNREYNSGIKTVWQK